MFICRESNQFCTMSRVKTTFFCSNCGHENPKWAGRCPSCGEWNTFTEEVVIKSRDSISGNKVMKSAAKPVLISDIRSRQTPRIQFSDTELNQVLGGGLVPGSVTLIGGEPGIGKSTLMLQVALQTPVKTLYISGEESEEQIKLRADRLQQSAENCAIVTETRLESIIQILESYEPEMVIIDSIQTLHSELLDATAGSIVQIRECAGKLLRYAKENDVPVLLIGHITKDGSIAGPKILEHMVDTVIQFEGDRHHTYRIIRPLKNRFGNTGEMGIYSMTGAGLEVVKNPSEVLLAQRDEALSGIATGCALEGMRPILLEVQSLVSSAVYGTPQRSSTGFDLRRLNMLLAVLEKRCGFRLGQQDVFVNIAGGLKMEDPALDLSIAAAVMSSYLSVTISSKTVFAAEVGLSGEIRAVQRIDQRISEAAKLGFEEIIISKYNQKIATPKGIRVKTYGRIDEVFRELFGSAE